MVDSIKGFAEVNQYTSDIDLGAAQSSIFGSVQNFFGSLSRLEPKITAQQQSCTQS